MIATSIPKYTQNELVTLINEREINLVSEGYDDLARAIEKDFIFDKELFLQCAEVLNIDKKEIFNVENISDISFRGTGSEKDIENIIKLFKTMVQQSKLRGNINV
ncbi:MULTISPECIES: hypothetical protein [Staphylococcus]|uniref:hypothetical protein n=1 Tax=Staphylococcus TaxID=1279 RepID=UPI001AEC0F13|nr:MULTISPECIES: hypothetical protein [Staphylococcus]WIL69518.1 hypothetical protein QMK35_12505 [Staphylococcus cohnii]